MNAATAVPLSIQPAVGVAPLQLMEYVPVMLSTPIVDVMPVKVPEAVVLREELHAAVVAVESSDLLQAPMTAIMPTIKTIQNSNFFIITSFTIDYRKMQDYSYIYVSGMVLTNIEITPRSHNLKQLKNASGQFPV